MRNMDREDLSTFRKGRQLLWSETILGRLRHDYEMIPIDIPDIQDITGVEMHLLRGYPDNLLAGS